MNAFFSMESRDSRLFLRGELDLLSSDTLQTTLIGLRGEIDVLDVGDITFIDCRGLRALIDACAIHKALRVENPSPCVVRLLELTVFADAMLGSEDALAQA